MLLTYKLHLCGSSSMCKTTPIAYILSNFKHKRIHDLDSEQVICLFHFGHLRYFFCIHFSVMVNKANTSTPSPTSTRRRSDRTSNFSNNVSAAESESANRFDKSLDPGSSLKPNETVSGQEENARCNKKPGAARLWQRNDSFSSCSSDSAVYCSSRHTQSDAIAQDVGKEKLIEENNGKKRHRHSSGSSALSSASDSSNKHVSTRVGDIFSCLDGHKTSSNHKFDELEGSIVAESTVKSQSVCYPSTITSKSQIETIVEEKTVTYTTCKSTDKSGPNEGYHNLRRQIRKTRCRNCDCGGSHGATVIVRTFTKVQRETTTEHGVPNNVKPVQHSISVRKRSVPALSASQHSSPLQQTFSEKEVPYAASFKEPVSHRDEFSKHSCNKRRRTEMDKLYDALHQIQWAKHMSPDNILTQLDFRRAANESYYSNKSKAEPPEVKTTTTTTTTNCKSRKVVKRTNLIKSRCSKQKISYTQDGSCVSHHTRQNKFCNSPVTSLISSRSTRASNRLSHANKPRNQKETLNNFFKKKGEILKKNGFHFVSKDKVNDIKNEVLETKPDPLYSQPSPTGDNIIMKSENVAKELESTAVVPDVLCEDNNISLKESAQFSVPSIVIIENDLPVSFDADEVEWPIEELMIIDETTHLATISACDNDTVQNYLIAPGDISCDEGDVVIACIDPYIVDIETSDLCYEEVVTECSTEITSPPLPLLTKISPVAEHSSEDNPPQLEPCTQVSLPITFNSNPLEDSNARISRTSKNDGNNQCLVLSGVEYSGKALTSPNSGKTIVTEAHFKETSELRCTKMGLHDAMVKDEKFSQNNFIPISDKAIDSHTSNMVSRCNDIHSETLLNNDLLDTKVDQYVMKDDVKCYNHILNNKGAQKSVMSMRLKSSVQGSGKCTQIRQKELTYGKIHRYPNVTGTRLKTPIIPLEYKSSSAEGSVEIPYTFTIHYKCITVQKNDGYTQIVFKLTRGHDVYFSVETLNELRDAIRSVANDAKCNVLIMNSFGKSFCLGLDLYLVLGKNRNEASRAMAVAVKEFIEALASFSKPLIVVVQGEASGLGVTMLAYTDVVIASDEASFHMPQSQLGFSPEGAATLMLPYVIGSTVAMDMMLRGRTLSAQEAYSYGLVTEVHAAKSLPFKLIDRVEQLVGSPNSVMESTKTMLRMHLYPRLTFSLERETVMLPKQWLSESCQYLLQAAFNCGMLG